MKEQFNRRNIEDSELFKQFEILRQEEIDGRKLTAAEMSGRLKKSKRHIFKLQEVEAKSTPDQLKAIREGAASINQVYNEIKKQEQESALSDSENATPQAETSEGDKLEPFAQSAFPDKNEESVSEEQIEQNIQEEIKKTSGKNTGNCRSENLKSNKRKSNSPISFPINRFSCLAQNMLLSRRRKEKLLRKSWILTVLTIQ